MLLCAKAKAERMQKKSACKAKAKAKAKLKQRLMQCFDMGRTISNRLLAYKLVLVGVVLVANRCKASAKLFFTDLVSLAQIVK